MPLLCRAVLLALLLAAPAAGAAEPLTLRIGWVVTPPELQPILFAKDGIARHLGESYRLEPIHFANTPLMISALAAGELDIVPFTFATLGTAIENAGMSDLRVIADEFQDGVEGYFSEHYLVLKDGPIRTIEDLRGKVVASNGIGSGVDMAMRVMLRRHGLQDHRDYAVVEVQFPNMKATLIERKVDLVAVPAAFAYDPELMAQARLLFSEADALGRSQFAMWTARAPFLQEHRGAVVDFLEDSLRALRWYLDPANHAEAVAIVARFTKLPPERFDSWAFTARDQYRDPEGLPDLPGLQRNLDAQAELGFLKRRLDIGPYIDLSLVKEAAARLP